MSEKLQPPCYSYWHRWSGRPRNQQDNLEEAIKASIRDPLWMLSRQWQMGEYQMQDAGTGVLARVAMRTTPVSAYAPGVDKSRAAARFWVEEAPLETLVEQLPRPRRMPLDTRIRLGRIFTRLLKAKDLYEDLFGLFVGAFAVGEPSVPGHPKLQKELELALRSNPQTYQLFLASKGRALDGEKLIETFRADNWIEDNIFAEVATDQKEVLVAAVQEFMDAHAAQFQYAAPETLAWKKDQMEYQFRLMAEGSEAETADLLSAKEYPGGRLDWYNFEVKPGAENILPDESFTPTRRESFTFVIAPVSFPGIPHPRWWQMEDGQINLGQLNADPTDLMVQLLADFALIHGNDWMLIPYAVPAGSICEVEGLMVSDVFGQTTWVKAAGEGAESDWESWSMFRLSQEVGPQTQTPRDNRLFIPPVLPKSQQGAPLEEILFARDEMANFVWAIETRILSELGYGSKGSEVNADQLRQIRQALNLSEITENTEEQSVDAPLKYQFGNSVPENWIPFIPKLHKGQIQLRRARLPRYYVRSDDPIPTFTRPRTELLSEVAAPFFIREQEVPRSGAKIAAAYQRTRWLNGQALVWLGRQKTTGRGQIGSNLIFDQVVFKGKKIE